MNEKYQTHILRISRSIYMKVEHLNRISEYAMENNLNISQSVDQFLQWGIAYSELMKEQKHKQEKLW